MRFTLVLCKGPKPRLNAKHIPKPQPALPGRLSQPWHATRRPPARVPWPSTRPADRDLLFDFFPGRARFVPPPEKAPPVAYRPPPPAKMKHAPDVKAAQTWVYPTNLPPRDYQYNIVRRALFDNTLVALPTGLGKTFIAGCLMLNYARWFPAGKIFFVAPTKPLVEQQARAFPATCGFLNDKIAMLTGATTPTERAAVYPNKQVFFMTSQTMRNDIQSGILDPRDVVLLVVDEAHRAVGKAAHAQVVQVLLEGNAHVRILALTATPASKPEGIQEVVDSLHLSRIEIRDELSPDLQPYVHAKTTEIVTVDQRADLVLVGQLMADLMQPNIKELADAGHLTSSNDLDAFRLHPYRCIILQRETRIPGFAELGRLARAMIYLREYSVNMFASAIAESESFKQPRADMLKKVLHAVRKGETAGRCPPHDKMIRLRELLLEHFKPREEGDGRDDFDPDATRVMVFCSFRAALDETVSLLREHSPTLRPVGFVGQSSDADGQKGLSQVEQKQVIEDFKSGKHNIMVATSIGEEGLDIGSVDRVFCYDAPTSNIRMLQRVGRTGRKRSGEVTVLVSPGRESDSWDKSLREYTNVQRAIASGEGIELRHVAPRLLPADVEPVCVQQVVPIDPTPPDFLQTKRPKVAKVKAAPKATATSRKNEARTAQDEGETATGETNDDDSPLIKKAT